MGNCSTFHYTATQRETVELSLSPQRRIQISDQILNIFDSHRQAHQSIADPELVAIGFRNGCVGHAGGMADEALYTAQAFRQSDQIQRLEESMNVLLQQIQYCSSQQF